jgi:transcriptional regulator with XRE-family HTH domain
VIYVEIMARPTNRERHPVSVAFITLRKHFGETQQEFAARLYVTKNTVARYETVRPPSGRLLYELIDLAKENGRNDLADVLASALPAERFFLELHSQREYDIMSAYLRNVRAGASAGRPEGRE